MDSRKNYGAWGLQIWFLLHLITWKVLVHEPFPPEVETIMAELVSDTCISWIKDLHEGAVKQVQSFVYPQGSSKNATRTRFKLMAFIDRRACREYVFKAFATAIF